MYYSKDGAFKAFTLLKIAMAIATISVLAGVSIVGFASVVDMEEAAPAIRLRNSATGDSSSDLVTGLTSSVIETIEIVNAYTVIIHSSDGSAISSPAFLNGNGNLLVSGPSTANGSRVTFGEKHGLTAGVVTVVSSLTGDYYANVVNTPD